MFYFNNVKISGTGTVRMDITDLLEIISALYDSEDIAKKNGFTSTAKEKHDEIQFLYDMLYKNPRNKKLLEKAIGTTIID